MSQDPSLPQWVISRLQTLFKVKPKCGLGSTHHICHCLQKRLIDAEAELAELRMNKYERAIAALNSGKDAEMRVIGNSMLPLIKSKSVVTYRRTADYQIGDVVFAKVKGTYLTHKVAKIDSKGRYLITNNKGYENGWVSVILARVIAIEGVPFGRPADSIDVDGKTRAGT